MRISRSCITITHGTAVSCGDWSKQREMKFEFDDSQGSRGERKRKLHTSHPASEAAAQPSQHSTPRSLRAKAKIRDLSDTLRRVVPRARSEIPRRKKIQGSLRTIRSSEEPRSEITSTCRHFIVLSARENACIWEGPAYLDELAKWPLSSEAPGSESEGQNA